MSTYSHTALTGLHSSMTHMRLLQLFQGGAKVHIIIMIIFWCWDGLVRGGGGKAQVQDFKKEASYQRA